MTRPDPIPAAPISDKAERRRDARARRAALDPADRADRSVSICDRLTEVLPGRGAVMTFASIGDEVDLTPLNRWLTSAGRLVLPRVEGRRLVAVPWDGRTALVRSSFGVPEPVGTGLDPGQLAAVVVPGLAFDRQGHRIGYGAGFYDRFLPAVATGCAVVGVCFAAQVVDDVGPEPHDVPVPLVVTEAFEIRPRRAADGP